MSVPLQLEGGIIVIYQIITFVGIGDVRHWHLIGPQPLKTRTYRWNGSHQVVIRPASTVINLGPGLSDGETAVGKLI